MSARSFSRRVGMGSLAHCLSGSDLMAGTTSSTVSDWKSTNLQSGGAAENDGVGASVSARTLATFWSKYWWKSTASRTCDSGTWPRPISTSIERQSCLGDERSESTLPVEKASRFLRIRARYVRRSAVHSAAAAVAPMRRAVVEPRVRRTLATRHQPSRSKLVQYRRCFGVIQLRQVVDVAVSPRVRSTQRRWHQRSAELVGVEQTWSTGTRRVHWTWLGHRR